MSSLWLFQAALNVLCVYFSRHTKKCVRSYTFFLHLISDTKLYFEYALVRLFKLRIPGSFRLYLDSGWIWKSLVCARYYTFFSLALFRTISDTKLYFEYVLERQAYSKEKKDAPNFQTQPGGTKTPLSLSLKQQLSSAYSKYSAVSEIIFWRRKKWCKIFLTHFCVERKIHTHSIQPKVTTILKVRWNNLSQRIFEYDFVSHIYWALGKSSVRSYNKNRNNKFSKPAWKNNTDFFFCKISTDLSHSDATVFWICRCAENFSELWLFQAVFEILFVSSLC